jgi:hypothetical protein
MTAIPVPPSITCYNFFCDPTLGIVNSSTGVCSDNPCVTPQDCDDGNACTIDECFLVVPTEPLSAKCNNTPQAANFCDQADVCFTYSCDPASGCVSTPVPVPSSSACYTFSCDPVLGIVNASTGICSDNPCTAPADCNDNNACTIDECFLVVPTEPLSAKCQYTDVDPATCVKPDLCFTYYCDPTTGCAQDAVPVPPNAVCTAYLCNPATGVIETTDLCPKQPQCTPPTAAVDCNDLNACTKDECVLSDPADATSALCVWTPFILPQDCDDLNACTDDSCDFGLGCVNTPVDPEICNDNDACTEDSCDPTAIDSLTRCVHTPVVCNETDVCHNVTCDVSQGCVVTDIVCPVTENCTVSGCDTNNSRGCYVDDAGTCGFPTGLVAGLAAGVVAGIVVAAVAGAALVGGGAAYAFSQGAGSSLGAAVASNPLYRQEGEEGTSALSTV